MQKDKQYKLNILWYRGNGYKEFNENDEILLIIYKEIKVHIL